MLPESMLLCNQLASTHTFTYVEHTQGILRQWLARHNVGRPVLRCFGYICSHGQYVRWSTPNVLWQWHQPM